MTVRHELLHAIPLLLILSSYVENGLNMDVQQGETKITNDQRFDILTLLYLYFSNPGYKRNIRCFPELIFITHL